MRFLVVDDSSTMRRLIRSTLKSAGYDDTLEAENGAAALELLRAHPVDVVITDWKMPVMSGLELVNSMRRAEALRHTPVLMVTTVAERPAILAALRAGVSGYMVKPFDVATLKQKVREIAGG